MKVEEPRRELPAARLELPTHMGSFDYGCASLSRSTTSAQDDKGLKGHLDD